MDHEQLLWNHYQQLSEEIKAADTLNYQVIGVVIAGAVALITAGFARPSPEERCWILLTVFAVTIPGRFLLEVARRRIWRVATYLELFIEPNLGPVKWQTRLTSRPPLLSQPLETKIVTSEFLLISALDLIAATLNFATALFINRPLYRYLDFAVVTGLVIHSLIRAARSKRIFDRGGEVQEGYRRCWREVRNEES